MDLTVSAQTMFTGGIVTIVTSMALNEIRHALKSDFPSRTTFKVMIVGGIYMALVGGALATASLFGG